ncbi:MAG: hydroxyphenylacetyl-CoA thioesterase PaaI [Methyloligellaceae bacterium]
MTDPAGLARRVAESMQAASPVLRQWGIELVDVAPGAARLAMTVRDDMNNGQGVCHGGILFTLADSAFGFACNTYNEKALAVACDIRYLRPAEVGDRLIAEAGEIWRQRRTGLYGVTVSVEGGEQVALFRGEARVVGGQHVEVA